MRWIGALVLWGCSSPEAKDEGQGPVGSQDSGQNADELQITGALNYEAPTGGLAYYYEAVEQYCSTKPTIDGEPGVPVNFIAQEFWPDGEPILAELHYTNTGQEAIYVAGFGDYGADGSGAGAWTLREENYALNPLPGLLIMPEGWVGVEYPEAGYGMVLLPGEGATLQLPVRITCEYASGTWLPVEVGDVIEGAFLQAHGTCLETVEEIEDYGLPCTPPVTPETTEIPATVTITEG